MSTLQLFTPAELAMLAQVMRPRVQTLADLHAAQVQSLPEGDASWADTAEELATAEGILQKVEA